MLQKGIKYLRDVNIQWINLYCFGSHVYGTNDAQSDWDYVAIVQTIPSSGSHIEKDGVDIQFYTVYEFQHNLDMHDMKAVECFFNPAHTKQTTLEFSFVLDKYMLRQSVSKMMNDSWDKGKKKLRIQEDFNLRIALKSLFHSIKIVGFGIQIANSGNIEKYDEYTYVLKDLYNIANRYNDLHLQSERELLCKEIEQKYRQKYNSLRTQFKILCPKEDLNSKRKAIRALFKKHKVEINKKLINEIIQELK